MFFLDICEEPAFLNLILFIKSILEIVGIVVPIVLIVMVTLDLVKIVMDASEKTIKNSSKSMLNRILAAVAVFFVPVIVNTFMNMIEQDNVDKSLCWTNANTETIAEFTSVKEAKRLSEQKEKQEKIAADNKRMDEEDKKRKEKVAENAKKKGGGTNLLETALGEVGNTGSKYWSFYPGGWADNWCAMFAFWTITHTSVTGNAGDCPGVNAGSDKCYYKSKIDTYSAAVWPYALWMAQHNRFYHSEYWAKQTGTYKDNGKVYEPQPGDFVFFNGNPKYGVYHGNPLNCNSELGHIAIVKEVKNGQLYYVGGNQDGDPNASKYYETTSVTIKSRSIGDSYIVGYGTWPK